MLHLRVDFELLVSGPMKHLSRSSGTDMLRRPSSNLVALKKQAQVACRQAFHAEARAPYGKTGIVGAMAATNKHCEGVERAS